MKNNIKKILLIIPAMGGILIDRFTIPRITLLLVIGMLYLLFQWLYDNAGLYTSVILFFSIFICRYIFLFGSFIKNGFAEIMKKNLGEAKGFELYKIITALMFFLSGSSFSLMINKSPFEIPFYEEYKTIFTVTGIMIAASAFIINVWSTKLVGIDIYYYKDLFLGRKILDFKKEGPYKIFSNPMYGPGQGNGYGTALIYGSPAGLTGILLNQIMMYIFYFVIEKPHIKKILLQKRKVPLREKVLVEAEIN